MKKMKSRACEGGASAGASAFTAAAVPDAITSISPRESQLRRLAEADMHAELLVQAELSEELKTVQSQIRTLSSGSGSGGLSPGTSIIGPFHDL